MRLILTTTIALAVFARAAEAQNHDWDECRHQEARDASIDAAGIRMLELASGSGFVKIEGRAGLTRIVVRGKACASAADLLDDIKLETRREGSAFVVSANMRDSHNRSGWPDREYARLDITIEVPAGMAVEIDDGSGEIDLSNLGAVRIDDGSGEIVANDIASVKIKDGSGEITLVDVTGSVEIEDGSGEIELSNIGGAIEIDDNSGEISVRAARSNVRISDSSGDIDVSDVAGDFVVVSDGSGGIHYDNVRGRIDVPRRRR